MPDQEFLNLVNRVLSVGLIVKNYKQLCVILNQEPTTSNSKKSQHKEWKRYFDYEKSGQKYIIIKIYSEPLPRNDKRLLGNNSIYIKHIELLLLNYLSRQQGYTATLTLKKLFLLLGMINLKYIEENTEQIKKHSDNITTFQINHFYQRTYQKLREIMFSSLNNLKNRRLIDYEELTMINIQEFDVIIEREATEQEKNIIRDIEKEVLINMGLESITLVHLKFKTKEFYNKINNLLKTRYDINYTYKNIKILFTKKYIDQALLETELIIEKQMLNDKIIKTIDEQAEKKLAKSIENYNEQVEEYLKSIIGKPSQMSLNKFFKFNDVYLYAQYELSELLLRYY